MRDNFSELQVYVDISKTYNIIGGGPQKCRLNHLPGALGLPHFVIVPLDDADYHHDQEYDSHKKEQHISPLLPCRHGGGDT